MRFEYISLHNFRQYIDERIEFTNWTPDANIIVIQGAMGAGKTNILNAITWCLYEEEKHLTSKSKGLEICNTSAMEKTKTGNSCEVEVELAIVDEHQNRIYIKRKKKYEKGYQGEIVHVPYEFHGVKLDTLLQVDRVIDNQTVSEPKGSAFISRLIPEELSPYFFFDGENLHRYFEESSDDIPEAVMTISQLDILEQVIDHLEHTENEMLRKQSDPSDDIMQYQREYDGIDNKITDNDKKIGDLKIEQRGFEQKVNEIDDWMLESTAGALKEKSIRQRQLERQITGLRDDLKTRKEDKRKLDHEWAAIALSYNALKVTVDKIRQAKEAGRLPAAYKKNFLENLLDDMMCICGNSLEEGSDSRKKIIQLLEESDSLAELSEDLADLSGRLRTDLERVPQAYDRLMRIRRSIRSTENQLDDLNDEKDRLDKELKGIDIEEVSRKQHERETYRAKSKNHEGLIQILHNDNERDERRKSDLKNMITRAMSRNKKYESDFKKREFCEKAIEIACRIRDEIVQEIRAEVEDLTKQNFIKTHWKKDEFSDVVIDDDYRVTVKDITGHDALGTLSRGETQILAYAFMNALNVVSGFDFPLVIDTPLGRISSAPRKALGKNLSVSLKGRQIILLMTDVEYTEDFKESIADAIAEEYRIDFTKLSDKKGGHAKLVKIDE